MRSLAVALFLAPLLSAPVLGQLVVDPRRLPLQTDTLAVYLIRSGDTTRTGMVVDQLSSDSARLIRIYATMDRVLGDRLDTIVSRLEDLRPVSYRTISPDRIAWLSFEGGSVTGWARLPNGDSTAVDAPLPPVAYDGTSFDLIVRASPLAEGFSVDVPSFLLGPNSVTTLSGSVTGSADVDGHACWVFKANFAGVPVTFWIDKETRVLHRQLMQLRADMAVLFRRPPKEDAADRAT